MPVTPEQRAEINRRNARKSTGPKTPEGKEIASRNAVKHGLTASKHVADAAEANPGGPETYADRLARWRDSLRPGNVLEAAMIERACRATWKLDQVARYEDAARAERFEHPASAADGSHGDPTQEYLRQDAAAARHYEAQRLGAWLMLTLDNPPPRCDDPPPSNGPFDADGNFRYDGFNDPHIVYRALCSSSEGVDWLRAEWRHILPGLPTADGPPPEGPVHFLEKCRDRALRLLGLSEKNPAPAQPLADAAADELKRLDSLRATLVGGPDVARRADLALFSASPDSQLLIRYEAAAERELHRAVNTLLKLRKDPDLVPSSAPAPKADPVDEPSDTPEPRPRVVSRARTGRAALVSAGTEPALRNEASRGEPTNPFRALSEGGKGRQAGRRGTS